MRQHERAAVLIGLGTYLPERVVTNGELVARLDTTDEWISSRTGIQTRRWADPGVATGDLAYEAGVRALKSAGVESVDAVVVATTTPDQRCPATAPGVAARMGMTCAAFDIAAVCAGFVYAAAAAAGLIAAGAAERVLLIGAETYSSILNPDDRGTVVIFGDGAGAAVLAAGSPEQPGALLGFDLGSDGTRAELIGIPAGGSRRPVAEDPADRYFQMRGREVFAQAVTRMSASCAALLDQLGWSAADVDRIVGHQANARILHSLADVLEIDRQRAVINIDRVGNTSAASIPLALADADLRPGHRVLLTAFGGGLAWGSTALLWPDIQPLGN